MHTVHNDYRILTRNFLCHPGLVLKVFVFDRGKPPLQNMTSHEDNALEDALLAKVRNITLSKTPTPLLCNHYGEEECFVVGDQNLLVSIS